MPNPICPNCGDDATGGWYVCEDCGKVFCARCEDNGKNPNAGYCPRCASNNCHKTQDYSEFLRAVKNSQN